MTIFNQLKSYTKKKFGKLESCEFAYWFITPFCVLWKLTTSWLQDPTEGFDISVRVVSLLLDNYKLFTPSTANDASKNMRVSYFQWPLWLYSRGTFENRYNHTKKASHTLQPCPVTCSSITDTRLLICTTGVRWPYRSNIGKLASFPGCWECPCSVSHSSA